MSLRRYTERLSVAIQRANADGVIGWRYSEYGSALYDSNSDPVFAALSSAPIDMAECDRDLRGGVAAGGLSGEGNPGGVELVTSEVPECADDAQQ